MGDQSIIDIHDDSDLSKLNPGDLVEFLRGLFSHWAVYIGNKEVVHLTGVSDPGVATRATSFSICGVTFNKVKVCIENIWEVAAGSSVRKNNSKDGKWSPLSPADIVKKAKSNHGNVRYNLLFSNCEHFANLCRYNKSKSEQAETFMTAAAVGITVLGAIALGVAVAAKYDKSVREKKRKFPTKR